MTTQSKITDFFNLRDIQSTEYIICHKVRHYLVIDYPKIGHGKKIPRALMRKANEVSKHFADFQRIVVFL